MLASDAMREALPALNRSFARVPKGTRMDDRSEQSAPMRRRANRRALQCVRVQLCTWRDQSTGYKSPLALISK